MVQPDHIRRQAARRHRRWLRALAAALLYFGAAVVWFAVFERLAARLAATPQQAVLYKGLVGLFFVIASALVVSWIVWRELRKQHRIQEALRASQAQLTNLIESALDAIVGINAKYEIVVFNPAAQLMFGCSAPDAFGKDVRRFISDFPGAQAEPVSGAPGSLRLWTVTARRSDATEFCAEASVSRWDSMENEAGYTLVVRDVTEQRRLQEELRQSNLTLEQRVVERTADLQAANQELESFCYSVAHDLRAPLRSIEGFARLLTEESHTELNSSALSHLSRIQGAALRMDELIEAWLQLSRIARGDIQWLPVDLSVIAATVVAELQAASSKRQVDFVCCPERIVRGDPGLLRILLQNLIGNAWKFTAKTGAARIEFGSEQREGGLQVFFVRDNGAGFEMKYASKLFQPFERLHSAHDYEGTGIGLATCQKIVVRHGGTIWAEARVNQGAVFNFTIQNRPGDSSRDQAHAAAPRS